MSACVFALCAVEIFSTYCIAEQFYTSVSFGLVDYTLRDADRIAASKQLDEATKATPDAEASKLKL